MAPHGDPWEQLSDIDGREKYRLLQVSHAATAEEIKKAYRKLARKYHPDKGGDAALFARIQAAHETLSAKSKRTVYDDWANQMQYRYVPHRHGQGGEEILLDELASTGILCNPFTQLVVLCEVCGRPSNKECWTCKMPICSFCTLKRHWREGYSLHWPLIDSDHMKTQLAKREFEKKRIDDAKLLDMEDPDWRSASQLADMRAFRAAALDMQDNPNRLVVHDYALARFYMWAQTGQCIHIAMHIPTGFSGKALTVDCNNHVLRVQAEGSPPLLERHFDQPVDTSRPIESFKTQDNRSIVLTLVKPIHGESLPRLFRGDSDGFRCLQPPYQLSETTRDVTVEADLPSLVESEDIIVNIESNSLSIEIPGLLHIQRLCWQPREEKDRADFKAINVSGSLWCLDETADEDAKQKTLMIILTKPEATEDEVTWKRGQRQDNLTAKRHDSHLATGYRFFRDDEDEFGLEDILQAICFLEAGETFVPAKPWDSHSASKIESDVKAFSPEVQQVIANLQDEESKAAI